MSLYCTKCGNTTEYNFGSTSEEVLCKKCASTEPYEIKMNPHTKSKLPTLLKTSGYFLLVVNLIASAFQVVINSKDGISVFTHLERIFISIIVLLICLGLAKVIEQNYLLLNEGKRDNKS